jgi:hypothetical protein
MNTENSFELNGETFVAVEIKHRSCKGCAFEFTEYCPLEFGIAECFASDRFDKREVIFKRATDCRLETENKDKNEN